MFSFQKSFANGWIGDLMDYILAYFTSVVVQYANAIHNPLLLRFT